MSVRWRRACALVAVACLAAAPARAESAPERIGLGVAFASPSPVVSLFGEFDGRWSGTATLGLGLEVRANYAREGARGDYWTFGGGYSFAGFGVARPGYGRAWRRGPWRWHLEATLNVPFPVHDDFGEGGLATAVFATYAVLVPVGFGVHYVFD